jgi:hypothetical protein
VFPVLQVVPSQQPVQVPGPQTLTQVPLALHSVPVGQATQTAPAVPQAVFAVPGSHLLSLQQPLGQLAGVHTQLLSAPHSVPVGQATQTAPAVPQAVFAVPALHWLFSQQPLGQLAGVQTQAPFLHSCPATHDVHARPLLPQNWLVVPASQFWVVASQQPFGQLVGVQRHAPPTHS